MAPSRVMSRLLPAIGAAILAGVTLAGPAAAATPVPPGGPGDVNGNGLLDSSETPDNPDLPGTQVPPGSPGDLNGNGQLDSSETPDNPDAT